MVRARRLQRRHRRPGTRVRPHAHEAAGLGRQGRGPHVTQILDDRALDTLFREGRSYMKWQARPVTDDLLHELYDLLKWAPTSANGAPARFAFLRSKEAK